MQLPGLNLLALLLTAPASVTPIVESPTLLPETPEPIAQVQQIEEAPKTKLELANFYYAPMNTHPNPFPGDQCTHGAASMKGNISWRGNANQWDDRARERGIQVSDTPIIGAVAQTDRGTYGHVAVVVNVQPGMVQITEKNYDYKGSVRTVWRPAGEFKYLWL